MGTRKKKDRRLVRRRGEMPTEEPRIATSAGLGLQSMQPADAERMASSMSQLSENDSEHNARVLKEALPDMPDPDEEGISLEESNKRAHERMARFLG